MVACKNITAKSKLSELFQKRSLFPAPRFNKLEGQLPVLEFKVLCYLSFSVAAMLIVARVRTMLVLILQMASGDPGVLGNCDFCSESDMFSGGFSFFIPEIFWNFHFEKNKGRFRALKKF
jgi:hypothetical protein